MQKIKKIYIDCPECQKNIQNDSKFCQYCGNKIISKQSWANSLADLLIKVSNDLSEESKMLKNLGFNETITKQMKTEDLIWRMFAVNLIIQEKENDKELNDILHNTVAKKIYNSQQEIQDFFDLIKNRYDEYHKILNLKLDDPIISLSMCHLEFFIFNKINNNEFPDTGKAYFASLQIAKEFGQFINFLREEWFK